MKKSREDAMRRALELAPSSVRALAIEAGVSTRLLALIRDGERTATPTTTLAVAEALERLAGRHSAAARELRDALEDMGAGPSHEAF